MERFNRILNGAIWLLAGLVIAVFVLTHLPPVQNFLGVQVGEALGKKLGTTVRVGRIDLGFFNRIIIDNVQLYDHQGKPMLAATRLSAKFNYVALSQGKIAINSAQLFGLHANFYRQHATAAPNFQFVLDSLASKDTTQHKPLDLAIRSLIVRNGKVSYNQLDAPQTPKFSPQHLHFTDISMHLMLNAFNEDSLNLVVKKLSLKEKKGGQLKALSLALLANRQRAQLQHFCLELPHTSVHIPHIEATYQMRGKELDKATLEVNGEVSPSVINLCDLAGFVPAFKHLDIPVSITSSFHSSGKALTIDNFEASARDRHFVLATTATITQHDNKLYWNALLKELKADATVINECSEKLKSHVTVPEFISRLGNIHCTATAQGGGNNAMGKFMMNTHVGNLKLNVQKQGNLLDAQAETDGLHLGQLLDDTHLGKLVATLHGKAKLQDGKIASVTGKASIDQIDYNAYAYTNILMEGSYNPAKISGNIKINDPNAIATITGTFNQGKQPTTNVTMQVSNFSPANLKLLDKWQGKYLAFDAEATITGNTPHTACGNLTLSNLTLQGGEEEAYKLNALTLQATHEDEQHVLTLDSDFGHMRVEGQYNYATLVQSITNLIASKLPTLPGLPAATNATDNDFVIHAEIDKSDWLQHLLNIPFTLHRPLHIQGSINDPSRKVDIRVDLPDFAYKGTRYKQGHLRFATPGDTLMAFGHLRQTTDGRPSTYWNIEAAAANNKLNTLLSFENNGKKGFNGVLHAESQFFKDEQNISTAQVKILPSAITIGDSLWNVRPSTIEFNKNKVAVSQFMVEHNKQHIIISGTASNNIQDTVTVDLQGVDVSYILNLVNFHSVEFGGNATGYAYIANAFGKPEASANLLVTNFKFENGRMGVLSANVNLNHEKEQLDIDAIAYDEDNARTLIKGYVSPKRNYIDLDIGAIHTRGEFLGSFCGSFMRDINVKIDGNLRLFGDLKFINLEGHAKVNGSLGIKPLNTTYTLRNAALHLVPDEIRIEADTIFDKYGHYGIVNGKLYHKSLTRLSYDIGVDAHHLLAFDTKEYGDDTFFGTVYATGNCRIRGKSGEVVIDAHVTPEENSFIEYNAASPDAITNQSFIHWNDRLAQADSTLAQQEEIVDEEEEEEIDITSNLHMNLLINCTPKATLRVLMDKQSGDYIALNGNGTIRANYYNKGAFNMFGTYEVEHGIYKLTIQNIIRRDFTFLPNGNIAFGGNPMEAALNLKAQYVINGVSLSDLNIGRSFTSNNIPVNCLMNITGTPQAPRVDFGLDLPSINSDAKQMVMNLINSEEELNQQVLYLLAVGRFYAQGNNNAAEDGSPQHSRTSLAMQSILSGTISQQLSNILGSVTNNSNWNLGANISTGDEGWNNAEYEGLLSGRLLNNRLLLNGQFGYRDNAQATTSFIGDFDLQYLIFPNGNFSVRVYNQTNDRYFTRNSMNTQGLGLILKKDFSSWRDFLGLRNSTKSKKKKKKKSMQSVK